MAVKSDGTLWSWGENSGGLGFPPSSDLFSPVQVGTLTGWSSLEAGEGSILALR
jgi:hypothetical protein